FGFEWTLVIGIGHPVQVVVRVGAAVAVQVLVGIFGLHDASVVRIFDAVAVGIRIIRTTVVVVEAVEVLGLVGAAIRAVQVSVSIPIARRRFDETTLGTVLRWRQRVGRTSVGLRQKDMVLGFGHEALGQL